MTSPKVYYVYCHYTTECPVPFFIGYGKNDAVNKSIKLGSKLTKSEMLRRVLDNRDILESKIISSELLNHEAYILQDQLINLIKHDFEGCLFQDSVLSQDDSERARKDLIKKYFPQLLTYEKPMIPYYDQFTDKMKKELRRIENARERLKKHRSSRPLPEKVQPIEDMFAPFEDNE